jgi:hypothetical protein
MISEEVFFSVFQNIDLSEPVVRSSKKEKAVESPVTGVL